VIRESRAESLNSYIFKQVLPISKTRQPQKPETPTKKGGNPIGMLSNSYNFLPELALNKPKPPPPKPRKIDEKFMGADPNSTFLNEMTEKSIGLNSHRNRHLSMNKYIDNHEAPLINERQNNFQTLTSPIKNPIISPRSGNNYHPQRFINIKESKAFN
jgi:hypothetical protein